MNWGATWIIKIGSCVAAVLLLATLGIGLAHAATQIVALFVGGHQ